MAADAGLIKSASQAYRSQDPNIKLGESLRSGFDKISQGIAKGQEIKRAKEEKENLRKEKQAASLKKASQNFQNSIVEVSGSAKTDKQTSLVLEKAKEWRSQSNEYFKIMEESSFDSPEYLEAQEGLLKIRSSMLNTVDSFNELNTVKLSRAEIAENNGYANFNRIEGVDGVDDNTVFDKTEAFIREDVEYAFDDNGYLRILDGKKEDGTDNYVSISDYDATLARVPDATVVTAFTAITDDLQKQGSLGKPIDKVDLEYNFDTQRGNLVKPGQDKTDQLLTFFTDNPIKGVSLKEGNEELIRNLQSKDIKVRTKAKKQAVDYLFGERDKGDGRLYKVAEELHKGKFEIYKKTRGKPDETEGAFKDRKSYEGLMALADRREIDPLTNTESSYYSRLKALEQKGGIGKPDDTNPHYQEMKKLENDLRKVIGGVQGKQIELNYTFDGVGRYSIANANVGQGTYTLDQLFSSDDTNPSNLIWAFTRK
tara:strand:- start:116 stop:1564 length:1449 start_codon:yes stop_codon:yes gene_type:complete